MKSKLDINDFLFILGLAGIGAGLFLWKGAGIAITVTGALMFLSSFFAVR
jgi:hypothetical protein